MVLEAATRVALIRTRAARRTLGITNKAVEVAETVAMTGLRVVSRMQAMPVEAVEVVINLEVGLAVVRTPRGPQISQSRRLLNMLRLLRLQAYHSLQPQHRLAVLYLRPLSQRGLPHHQYQIRARPCRRERILQRR